MPLTTIFDFKEGLHQGTQPGPGGRGLFLAPDAEAGTWSSPEYRTSGPFNWAVASWNGAGERLEVQLRVAAPGGWSPWFSFGTWSPAGEKFSVPEQKVEGLGELSVDTLLLQRQAQTWQIRVQIKNGEVRRLYLATALRSHRSPDGPDRSAWGRELDLPMRSQMVYPDGGNVWCSPTSLAMVMAFWGVDQSIPDQVVPGVYDAIYEGHGNWPFNTAYAGLHGFEAWVDRLAGFAELEGWIARGVPVICSVLYSRDWLENAPIEQTGGHLLVVRGFTETGDVIVNDPAAPSDELVRLVYKREQFRRAWLDRGGVVYIVKPGE